MTNDTDVENVRRYCRMMTDSISPDRREMARDILAILDGRNPQTGNPW